MPENQNHFRLTNRPLPEAHDEELLRLARRLEVYRDPEQLMGALPVELVDLFRENSLVLAFCYGSNATSWLTVHSKSDSIASTPKDLDAQESLHLWIEVRQKPFILSSLKEQSPFPELTDLFQEWGKSVVLRIPFEHRDPLYRCSLYWPNEARCVF